MVCHRWPKIIQSQHIKFYVNTEKDSANKEKDFPLQNPCILLHGWKIDKHAGRARDA